MAPAPTTAPGERDPATVTAAGEYRPGDPVWLYRWGQWRAGVVIAASARAAAVRYRPNDNRAVGVDTALPHDLARRDEADQYLDGLPGC